MRNQVAKIALIAGLAAGGSAAFAESNGNKTGADLGVSTGVDTGSVSGGASAQVAGDSSTKGTSSGASSSTDASSSSTMTAQNNAGGSGSDMDNYGRVISSLRAGNTASVATELDTMGTDIDADVILLSDLKGNAASESGAIDQAIQDQQAQIDMLRSSVQTNASLAAALEEKGYSPDNVVAATVEEDGSVALIVDDNS